MTVEYLGKGNDDGTSFGNSASDLISLYAVSPLAQQTAPSTVVTTASTTVLNGSYPYGFTTATQPAAIITAVNDIIDKLTLLGVWA